jgi:predicted nuclease of predicted toxin-antitoxin system
MKVLVDMNLSPSWARFLAEAGLDAVHWADVGPGNAPDTEVLLWAAERGYVVLTADLVSAPSWLRRRVPDRA